MESLKNVCLYSVRSTLWLSISSRIIRSLATTTQNSGRNSIKSHPGPRRVPGRGRKSVNRMDLMATKMKQTYGARTTTSNNWEERIPAKKFDQKDNEGSSKKFQPRNTPGTSKPFQQRNTPGTSKPFQQRNNPGTSKPFQQRNTPRTSKPFQQRNTPGTSKPFQQRNTPGTSKPFQQRNTPGLSKTFQQKRFERISHGVSEININAKGPNPAFDVNIMSDFQVLNLRDDVLQALDGIQVSRPTVIQMLAIPTILKGKHVFCAAQTGSGKTLSYLAPIISRLREEEDAGFVRRLNRPRVCIVVPGRELAVQLLSVATTLSHLAPFRSVGLIGGKNRKWMKETLKQPVDIVVATPGTLSKFTNRGLLFFSDLRYLVIDEADTMLDSSFRQTTLSLLKRVKISDTQTDEFKRTQCIFVAATLPKQGVLDVITDTIPGLKVLTSGLHQVLPHVKHTFIKSLQMEVKDKLLALLQKNLNRPGRKFMIFTNTSKTCNWLSRILDENQIKNIRLHSKVESQSKDDQCEQFQKSDAKVIICTDTASRGLDTSDVSHVINYDFPSYVIDYIHRAGRTGRARATYQGSGEVVSYLTHNRHITLARKIQTASEKNEKLEDVRLRRTTEILSAYKTERDHDRDHHSDHNRHPTSKTEDNKNGPSSNFVSAQFQ